jgi:DNA-binding LacI/PurR family transcriptional regulator
LTLLYQQIRNAILDDIRSGKLVPGDPVPSELELARNYGVSRITSKKALDTLQQDGLVIRERGRGTFVAVPRDPATTVLREPTPRRIGFVVPDMSDTFGVQMLDGIEERVRALGYQLVLRRTHGRVSEEAEAISEFIASGVAGLIVFPVHGEFYNAELLKHVLAGFPVVLVDRVLPGIPVSSVCTDNVAAARCLTGVLLEHGHRTIAFVSPPPNRTSSIEQRLRGFRTEMRQHGGGFELTTLECTLPGKSIGDGLEQDQRRIREFLAEHSNTTGFIACEYTLALLIEMTLAEDGLLDGTRQIVCFDAAHEPFARYRFTHIRQDEHRIGSEAVDLLVQHIDSESSPRIEPRQVSIAFNLIDAYAG